MKELKFLLGPLEKVSMNKDFKLPNYSGTLVLRQNFYMNPILDQISNSKKLYKKKSLLLYG